MIFYDFEVFKCDWLVVAIDVENQKYHVITNDREELIKLYEANKNNIWVGFNSRHYDQYIFKAILADFDPKNVNDYIIVKDRPGWSYSSLFRQFPLINYDVMQATDRGLKSFEGFMGHNIMETSVPFDIDRKLTRQELDEVIKYCIHDVEETIEVFIERQSDFNAQMGLLKMFKLPLSYMSKTKAQLSAEILDAKSFNRDNDIARDEFDISFPDNLDVKKYNFVVDWYKDKNNRKYHVDPENPKSKKHKLECTIAGIPHVFGWGGLHGAREQYAGEGYYINMDVASLYPSLMIIYELFSRNCNPQKFKDIVDLRLKYKHEGNSLQQPLKIVINGTYGAMKAKTNPLYDPKQANNVCVHGQLLLLDLIEKLEEHAEIIQSNTDGVLIKLRATNDKEADEQYNIIDDVAYSWEQRTGLTLEFSEFSRVYQKDVNNYVMVSRDGKVKSKGAYVKKLSRLDYDLAIVNRAMVEYMVHGTPVEKTIYDCDNLIDFQQIKKISNKYDYALHGDVKQNEMCLRCFASKSKSDGGIFKVKKGKTKPERVASTPINAFIDNDNIEGKKVPRKLDRQWYVDLAKTRLKQFGVM